MAELEPCKLCQTTEKHIMRSGLCLTCDIDNDKKKREYLKSNCGDVMFMTSKPHPAIRAVYDKLIFGKHPAELTGDDMFEMVRAIKKAVEG